MELVAQDKLNEILARGREGISRERMDQLVDHIRKLRPEMRAATHKVLSENLQGQELEFYKEIVVPPPDDAAGAVAAVQPPPVAPSPEAVAIAHSEGARAAEAESTRSRSR